MCASSSSSEDGGASLLNQEEKVLVDAQLTLNTLVTKLPGGSYLGAPPLSILRPEFAGFKVEGTSISLHKELLLYFIPFLKDFFQKQGNAEYEIQNNTAIGVGLFVQWAYTNTLSDKVGNLAPLQSLIDVGTFAHQMNVPDLQHDALKGIIEATMKNSITSCELLEAVRTITERGCEQSPIYDHLVRYTCMCCEEKVIQPLRGKGLPEEFLFDLVAFTMKFRNPMSFTLCQDQKLRKDMVGVNEGGKID